MSDSAPRRLAMLRAALADIVPWLDNPAVTEIMLNPDGSVWVNEIGQGMYNSGVTLTPETAERIICLIAATANDEINPSKPRLAAKLPHWGARVQASIPPYAVDGPTFNLRLPAKTIYTVSEYVAADMMTQAEADHVTDAILNRRNILIGGGTGSGKTTFANALLALIAETNDRVILIEDNLELQCRAPNLVRKLVSPPELTLSMAVFDALREYPKRLIVGEVRDKTAYDLINIWNTGHPGNLCTLHADSAEDSLDRLNRLAQQAQPNFDFRPEIGKAVSTVVHLVEDINHPAGRRVSSVIEVEGFTDHWVTRRIA